MRKTTKILRLLITGGATMILSACYGPVLPEELSFGTVKAKTRDGKPIPGLKVSYKSQNSNHWSQSEATDSNGESDFIIEPPFLTDVKIEDVDGEENLGDFKSEIFATDDEYSQVIMDKKADI